MSIWYGSADLTFNATPGAVAKVKSARIPALTLCGANANCMYDLMVLTSTDTKLRAYAKKFVFNGAQDTLNADARRIVNSFDNLMNPANYYYVQLGYGNIKDDRYKEYTDINGNIRQEPAMWRQCQGGFTIAANNLQYRLTYPSFKVTKSYFQQRSDTGQAPDYTVYPEAILLVGKGDSTTASGDSGGPLYAVDKSKRTNVFLLGVSTGADMEAAAKPTSRIFKNVLSTSVKPYMASLLT